MQSIKKNGSTVKPIDNHASSMGFDSTNLEGVGQNQKFTLWSESSLGIRDIGMAVKEPFHITEKGWMKLGGVLTITGLAFLVDNDIRGILQRNHTPTVDNFFQIGERYGSPVIPLSVSTLMFSGGLIFQNEWSTSTGRMALEAVAISGITSFFLKSIIARSRPVTNQGAFHFNRPSFAFVSDQDAFPSGHTTVAFALSTVFSRRIQNVWASIGLYTLASMTALNRMYDDRHWLSDTILGAFIGIAVANFIVDINEPNEYKINDLDSNPLPPKVSLGFTPNGTMGLQINF
ncbi:MAG: phosphatase PAP2 family protein [Chloroherpetonaceae bacterium]|nr:phosphatase PAP2 family protein [Chloroherpetonaceae bacterium]